MSSGITDKTPTTQPDRCEQIAREKYYQTGDTCPCCGIGTYLPSGVCGHCDIHRDSEYAAHRRSRILKHVKQQPKSDQIARESYYTDAGAETPYHCLRCKVGVEKSGDICGWCEADQRNRELRQQPKNEPSREFREIAINWLALNKWKEGCIEEIDTDQLRDAFVAALQSKQDELNALREEVRWLRAALALRDKLKASQPTLPPPQTPHQ